MKFIDEAHEKFYENAKKEYEKNQGFVDCYSKTFFYLMGLCRDTRMNFSSLFNMQEQKIIITGIHAGWQTGTSYKICRLAFNLWNGFCFENNKETGEEEVSGDYAVDEIFCCEYAEYFFEAIRLRYPEYCHV